MQDSKSLGVRPLKARSVVLSALLGFHPPRLPVRALIRIGQLFGITEGTIRVALTRMVADGDVVADNGAYRLSGRLLERQARQDESSSPHNSPAIWTAGRSSLEWRSLLTKLNQHLAAE